MPRLWSETIETHRREVRETIMEEAARLAAHKGPLSVTMSEVAEAAGIGRATLYKYFPNVESILSAWHERRIRDHIRELTRVRSGTEGAWERLTAVLQAYTHISHRIQRHRDSEFGAFLHRDGKRPEAHHELRQMVGELLGEAVAAGAVRADVPTDELAGYCIGALSAPGHGNSRAALDRLVAVVLDGLRARI